MQPVCVSYSTVVLYIGINKVWGFMPKNPTKKSAKYLLSDRMTALVRHSQAQKCLQNNSNCIELLRNFKNFLFNRFFY